MSLGRCSGMVAAAVLLALGSTRVARADFSLGAIGDSYTDEFTNNRPKHANWMEQLGYEFFQKRQAGKDYSLGGFEYRDKDEGDYRGYGQGYGYNWAASGDTTDVAIENQINGWSDYPDFSPHGLRGQIQNGRVNFATVAIGFDNIKQTPSSGGYDSYYDAIYQGDQAREDQYIDNMVGDIESITHSLRGSDPRNPDANLILATVPDYTVAPLYQAKTQPGDRYDDAARRQRVHDAVQEANGRIKDFARSEGLPVVDMAGLLELGREDPFTYAGIDLEMDQPDLDDGKAFWADESHAGTIWQGLFANAVLTAANEGYGVNASLIPAQQIVDQFRWDQTNSTRPSAGQDHFNYSDYVIVPEPASLTLMMMVLGLGLLRRRRRASPGFRGLNAP